MDDKEFAEIVKNTKAVVLSAIKRHQAVRFYHAIDDTAQETYIRAYRALTKKNFRAQASMETWLYAIAKNESLRMTRKLEREEEKLRNAFKEPTFCGRGIWFSKTEDIKAKTVDAWNLIKVLPEKYKAVVELNALGLTENQISERLSIKRGTVKSRLSRGREIMQKMAQGGV